MTCPVCSAATPATSRFCGACGAPLAADTETRLVRTGSHRSTGTGTLTPTPAAIDHGRFAPGTVLADRYRIIGRTGRGDLHGPPMNISGQVGLVFDPSGRLLELHGVPPEFDDQTTVAPAPDWTPLFRAAALDPSRFSPASPHWTPRQFADARAAWTGSVPEHPNVTLRVEAAAYRGRPVFFALAWPWTEPTRMIERPRARIEVMVGSAGRILVLIMLAGAVLLAWRNAWRRRGDGHGAAYLATLAFSLSLAGRCLRMAHVADPRVESERIFLYAIGGALFHGALMWVMYMALEPAVRRYWPDTLLGWSRLVSGRIRDPRVGARSPLRRRRRRRDRGRRTDPRPGVAGVRMAAAEPQPAERPHVDRPAGRPRRHASRGERLAPECRAGAAPARRSAHAASKPNPHGGRCRRPVRAARLRAVRTDSHAAARSGLQRSDIVILVSGIVRLGLLASIVMFSCYRLVNVVPLTADLGAWHARPTVVALLLILLVIGSGCYLARGGVPLFGRTLLEE